ncbi:hypothetical protein [Rhizobium ruizarguesonis]|jgi:hypothetical protein|uniref:hypothetical protein n=1 Tax=Rhizobium ruizarguesonis TaxID=2081791 RepID=UPI001030BE9E|nr:hypothetical protein [Rhizobium ruizarguesonis]TBE08593.1 hypothetical protein ELH12_22295 [Rhizobium ruizarguesonis]TBE79908.1 hypothetical protein ELH01_23050 [Rhizobium ruizarguesonis]TBE89471.1 hypothetical protein ELG99_22650 [Rhizobium ruizarguesonis]
MLPKFDIHVNTYQFLRTSRAERHMDPTNGLPRHMNGIYRFVSDAKSLDDEDLTATPVFVSSAAQMSMHNA